MKYERDLEERLIEFSVNTINPVKYKKGVVYE